MEENRKGSSKKLQKQSSKVNDIKNKNESSKDKKLDFDSPSERLIHQILPFIYIVLAILIEVCLILASFDGTRDLVGVIGNGLRIAFLGIFGWCAFIIPVVLVNLALNWRRFVDSRIVISKIVFSFLFLISLSALIHIFVKQAIGDTDFWFIDTIWQRAIEFKSGGFFGGLLGELSFLGLNFVGSIIVLGALTLVFLLFSLGMTPRNIGIFIKYKSKLAAEKRKEKRDIKREEKRLEKEENDRLRREEKEENDRLRREEKEENDRLRREEKEKREREARERAEALRKKEEEEILRLKSEEDRKVEEAERRAREIEEQEKLKKDMAGKIPIIRELGSPVPQPEEKDDQPSGNDGNRIELDAIFKNPPEEFDKNNKKLENPLVEDEPSGSNTSDTLEIEMKPITDMEGVPDDGEEGAVVPENVYQEYVYPPIDILKKMKSDEDEKAAHEELMANAQALMETLKSFNVRIQEITYSRGPTITRYELKPDVGVRIRSIANLVDDIALSLATTGVRIEAPIPNKPAVGVEVPNKHAATVGLRSLIETQEFSEKKSKLTACLGKDVGGNPIYFDIGKMPHMLIAGTTGSGKSVCINCIIVSLLYKASPRDVKLILIDPKKVEFNIYKNIPHLYAPIVSDPKKAAGALASAVAEMERRFELIEEVGARDIAGYNAVTADDPTKEYLPYMVIIIDELADLMMTAPDDVENAICRIAQKARAAGIHLIIGTQRPSVDVITGLLKSNIPSRIAFAVASQVDSRTILDGAGAEKLIGRGDMLFSPIGVTKPMRIQGAFVSESEIEQIVDFLKDNNEGVQFNDEFMRRIEEEAAKCGNKKGGGGSVSSDDEACEEGGDPKFKAAVDVAIEMGKISTSLLQRRLEIGYGRAAKIIDRMEELGYVSPPDGNKPRRVLVTKMEFMEKRINDDIE